MIETTDFNLDFEKFVLGAILVEPERLSVISNILKEEHLWDSSHREIFKTILEIHKQQKPISILTVANELENKGKLKEIEKEIGIVSYLSSLLNNCNIVQYDVFYCKDIVEKYYVRKIKEEKTKDITTKNAIEIIKNITEYGEQLAQLQLLGKPPEPLNIEKATELLKTTKGGKITRYTKLDQLISFAPSELIIIGARTRHGKTTFAMNLLLNMAKEYPIESFIFFSYEENFEHFYAKMLKGLQISLSLPAFTAVFQN